MFGIDILQDAFLVVQTGNLGPEWGCMANNAEPPNKSYVGSPPFMKLSFQSALRVIILTVSTDTAFFYDTHFVIFPC
jgi:hypothetical protein